MTPTNSHHQDLRSLSDSVLLDDWRSGNRDAGHVLIDRHYDDVYAFVHRKVGDDSLVADVVQDVFETAVRKRDKIGRGFRVYAYCTAKLKVLEFQRARLRDFHELPRSSQLGGGGRGASSMLDGARLHSALAKAFEKLGTYEQCILVWKYVDDRTQEELGEYLDLTKQQINGQLNRARARWRELIESSGAAGDGSKLSEEQLLDVERWLGSVYGVSTANPALDRAGDGQVEE